VDEKRVDCPKRPPIRIELHRDSLTAPDSRFDTTPTSLGGPELKTVPFPNPSVYQRRQFLTPPGPPATSPTGRGAEGEGQPQWSDAQANLLLFPLFRIDGSITSDSVGVFDEGLRLKCHRYAAGVPASLRKH
jgi:hypothetical protein